MRKLSVFIFFIFNVLMFSQYIQPNIKLVRSWENAQTFKGKIAGEPITMHLQYLRDSGWHDKVFSVKGWYYYDRIKKRIPLMGFYNGDLFLYNFKNDSDYKKIINAELFCWSDPCPQFSDYNEFIKISQNNHAIQNGFMNHNHKKHILKLYTNNLDITLRNEYLYLPNGKKYNLREVLDEYGGNQIVSTYTGATENRIMLYFERDANFNKHGMCGATEPETGYRLLTFRKNWKMSKFQVYSTNSCIADVSFYKEYKTKYDFLKAYYVVYKDDMNLLIVNLKNATFGTKIMEKNTQVFFPVYFQGTGN